MAQRVMESEQEAVGPAVGPAVTLRVARGDLGQARSSVDLASGTVTIAAPLGDRDAHEQLLASLGHLYARHPGYLRPTG